MKVGTYSSEELVGSLVVGNATGAEKSNAGFDEAFDISTS